MLSPRRLISLCTFSVIVVVTSGTTGTDVECDANGDCQHATLAERLAIYGDFVSNHHPHCADSDKHQCEMKALFRHCATNATALLEQCPVSCGLCNNHDTERSLVKTSYGPRQHVPNENVLNVVRRTQKYMIHRVFVDEQFASVRSKCQNRHENCSLWAAEGQCVKNASYMKKQCAPACKSCAILDVKNRCPFDEAAAQNVTAWNQPGDLDRFFSQLVQNETLITQHDLTVLSRPPGGPWIVQLENFVSPTECQELIQVGHDLGYQPSKDIGAAVPKFDGSIKSHRSLNRTSSTAWCRGVCERHARPLHQRMADLVALPLVNSESLQLLEYQVGQFYDLHHDYTPLHAGRMAGVRILTVFLYLNRPARGGGTSFPYVNNLTVWPRKGRVLVWPSVLNEQPGKMDPRTQHQALPVEEGVKYGVNAWFHERDFRTPQDAGCGL